MNKNLKKITSICLLTSMLMTIPGCSSSKSNQSGTKTDKVISELSKKYEKESQYVYNSTKKDVKRNHSFDYDINFDIQTLADETGSVSSSDIVQIFQDSKFQYPVSVNADFDKETGTMTLAPYNYPVGLVPDEDHGGNLYDKGDGNDWGNAQTYYQVQYVDFETGEKLSKPIVTPFTVKHEISDEVKVDYTLDNDGVAGLKWNKVKDANEYAILKISYRSDNIGQSTAGEYVELVTTTKKTSWKDNENKDEINRTFRMIGNKSQDTLYNEAKQSGTTESVDEYIKNATAVESEITAGKDFYFAVVAMNKKGTSALSNFIDARKAASQTPYELCYYLNEGGIRPYATSKVDSQMGLLSSHAWVEMCDGTAKQMLINYDTNDAKIDDQKYFTGDYDETTGNISNLTSETIRALSIPYKISNTSLKGYVLVENYDEETYKKDLKELKKRQDALKSRMGSTDALTTEQTDSTHDDEGATQLDDSYQVNGSNKLVAYLALGMMNGEEVLDLTEFPEATDYTYLVDAWYEAVYQNPLVLGVSSMQTNITGTKLFISYDMEQDEIKSQQAEIKDKVKEINAKIINSAMSDYEKELAINEYLCQNTEYDTDALENAEKNNFTKVDDEFQDSFSVYGILMNGKGVCAGYAGAFKLLADEAELDSIVVTGNLNGSLPHAWNRVKIDDEWVSVDATNNDIDYVSNSLFNIPDSVSSSILVEDELFMMDNEIANYKATSDVNEYYRKNNKYFDETTIVDQLVNDLQVGNTATLRTNYSISDADFQRIGSEVSQKAGISVKGTYFLGVIYLQK